MSLKVAELFAGVGGFRLGLEKNGFKYNKAQVDSATRMEGPHKGYAEYLFYRN